MTSTITRRIASGAMYQHLLPSPVVHQECSLRGEACNSPGDCCDNPNDPVYQCCNEGFFNYCGYC